MKTIPVTLILASVAFSMPALARVEPSISQSRPDQRQQLLQLNREISDLADAGNFRNALDKAQRAKSLAEKACGRQSQEYAGTLQTIGNLYTRLGQLPNAVEHYKKAVSAFENVPGSDGKLIRLYKELAAVQGATGNLLATRDSLQKAITLSERITKLNNPEGVELLFRYAATLEQLRKPSEAASYWARGLSLLENINGGRLDSVELPPNSLQGRVGRKPGVAPGLTAEGVVAIRVTVDENGMVSATEVITGKDELTPIALRLARETVYAPLSNRGKPLKMSGIVVYRFPLEGTNQHRTNLPFGKGPLN